MLRFGIWISVTFSCLNFNVLPAIAWVFSGNFQALQLVDDQSSVCPASGPKSAAICCSPPATPMMGKQLWMDENVSKSTKYIKLDIIFVSDPMVHPLTYIPHSKMYLDFTLVYSDHQFLFYDSYKEHGGINLGGVWRQSLVVWVWHTWAQIIQWPFMTESSELNMANVARQMLGLKRKSNGESNS